MMRAILFVSGTILLAGAVAMALVWLQPRPEVFPAVPAIATAEITRGTLRDTKTIGGTLGYGDLSTLRADGQDTHMLTWLPQVGITVARGELLFRLDGQPTILFFGTQPQNRTLRFDLAEDAPVWVELEAANDAVKLAELALSLERQRLGDAEARLADLEVRLADADAAVPITSEIIELNSAVTAAANTLDRVHDLVAGQLAPAADLAAAEAALASARSAFEAALRALRKDAASARLEAATARITIAEATAKRDTMRYAYEALAARKGDDSDIQQLADNLAALGYRGELSEQIRDWQQDTGLPATGIVGPEQLIVAPGPVHIAAHRAGVGESVAASSTDGGAILDYSSVDKRVTVALAVADQALAARGRPAVITLPDDSEIEGTITAIGSVVTDGTIEVIIAIADQSAIAGLEVAAVDVALQSASRDDVLSVPITALLALAEGGFAVEIVEAGAAHLTAVDLGLFASGRVEISGDGIAEGVRVSVPQ